MATNTEANTNINNSNNINNNMCVPTYHRIRTVHWAIENNDLDLQSALSDTTETHTHIHNTCRYLICGLHASAMQVNNRGPLQTPHNKRERRERKEKRNIRERKRERTQRRAQRQKRGKLGKKDSKKMRKKKRERKIGGEGL